MHYCWSCWQRLFDCLFFSQDLVGEVNIITFLRGRYVQVARLIDAGNLLPGAYIYINPFNYFMLRRWASKFDYAYYRVDGIYLTFILKVFLGRSILVARQSFDLTSLAPVVLGYSEREQHKVFVAGGKPGDADQFIQYFSQLYPRIKWIGSCDGYRPESEILSIISESGADMALLGLGNLKQERVACSLAQSNPSGYYFTCGAFISQSANGKALSYYPDWINRYHLRWAYRFVNEPHVIKRVAIYYPIFLLLFLYDVIKNQRV